MPVPALPESPPAHVAPPPIEWAVGAYAGSLTPPGPEARDPALVLGGTVRVRPLIHWAGELDVGWEGRGVDPRLTALHLIGSPYAPMVPFLLVGGGARVGDDLRAVLEAGFGFDMVLTRHLDARADARVRYTSDGEAAMVLTIGPQLHRPHAYDGDRDGVADDDDACPGSPEDRDDFRDDDGCPDPDNDADGVDDLADACLGSAEDQDGFLDSDGCPDPDNDGDGLPDVLDTCPMEPEDRDGHDDVDGCFDPDNDGDHLYDGVDACPNVPEDDDGFEDTDGCPDPDNDGDGVGDLFDGAPDSPENINGYQDQDGIPEELPPILARFLGDQRHVAFSGAELTHGGGDYLDLFAAVLRTFPGVHPRLEVADEDEAVAADRAAVVKARLLAGGVPEDTVTVVAETRPGPVRITLEPP